MSQEDLEERFVIAAEKIADEMEKMNKHLKNVDERLVAIASVEFPAMRGELCAIRGDLKRRR